MDEAVVDRGDRESEGDDAEEDSPLQSVAAGAVTFLTLGVAFGLLALDVSYWWVVFPVGFGGGMPLVAGLARWYESRESSSSGRDDRSRPERSDTDAALADLRERYARGELDDEEFEARVERLLETESISDAKSFAERQRTATATGDTDDDRATGDDRKRAVEDDSAVEDERA